MGRLVGVRAQGGGLGRRAWHKVGHKRIHTWKTCGLVFFETNKSALQASFISRQNINTVCDDTCIVTSQVGGTRVEFF